MIQGLGDGLHTPEDPRNHPVGKRERVTYRNVRRETQTDRRRHRAVYRGKERNVEMERNTQGQRQTETDRHKVTDRKMERD